MTLLITNGRYIFLRYGFNVFYVIMKGVRIITNFEGPIYQTYKITDVIWKQCKTQLGIGQFVICLKCEI